MKKSVKVLAFVLTFVVLALALTACAPNSNPDKAVSALKKKEYTAAQDTLVVPAAVKLLTGKNVTSFVSGTKTVENKDGEKKTETVGIVYFESKADANDAWEKMQDYAKDQNKDKDTDWQVKKSGKMIYWGTKAAINAAA